MSEPTKTTSRGQPSLLFYVNHLHIGALSIVPQGLQLALEPSPLGLDHGITTWHTGSG